jgi:ubiquinone/menaquinone biosynthesis C-methylase UbiE
MTIFSSLPLCEQASQLSNPVGPVGLAVAEWLNDNNRESTGQLLAMLGVQAGCHVLEVGFGNGRVAPAIVGQAADVHYAGIDISPTMVEEATRFNAQLVSVGDAEFHLAACERIPFADASFDRVLSIGVMHFWMDPITPLLEVRRVMRPNGVAVLGALDPRSAPAFARPEFGFYLRTAAEWDSVFRTAGFGTVHAQVIETDQMNPEGTPAKRYAICVNARTT